MKDTLPDTVTLPRLTLEELETVRAISQRQGGAVKLGWLRPGEWRCRCNKIRAATHPGCRICGEKA